MEAETNRQDDWKEKTATESLWRPKKDSGEDVMFIRCYIIFFLALLT